MFSHAPERRVLETMSASPRLRRWSRRGLRDGRGDRHEQKRVGWPYDQIGDVHESRPVEHGERGSVLDVHQSGCNA